ncbi:hypothetical protein IHN63_00720 [Deinococcus sp. 6YEL10]|uniref:hypothetical protein n=1 Tax=Deinococcus sp. 6YEL10 TaxID=2745870 RepID=UPI001E32C952|nr:hypothetical protein [Deinococcus sp. 6YEL10]MCD0159820.1 hypothetical protein [Deinococcus sp. 6YEL10]
MEKVYLVMAPTAYQARFWCEMAGVKFMYVGSASRAMGLRQGWPIHVVGSDLSDSQAHLLWVELAWRRGHPVIYGLPGVPEAGYLDGRDPRAKPEYLRRWERQQARRQQEAQEAPSGSRGGLLPRMVIRDALSGQLVSVQPVVS